MASIEELIRTIPDFPIKGVMFRDVTTLFGNAKGFQECIERLTTPYKNTKVDKVIGLEHGVYHWWGSCQRGEWFHPNPEGRKTSR